MTKRIRHYVIKITELHRRLGGVIREVALSDKHFIIEKGGLPVVVMMSITEYEKFLKEWKGQEFDQITRLFGEEAERQGLTEEKLMEELEEDKREPNRQTR